jgi:hypothetical protein
MTMSVALVPNGLHHAAATGSITAGAGFGEIAAVGANQLMQLRLPFSLSMAAKPGFAEQMYVTAKSLDGNVADVRLDAAAVIFDTVSPILQLRVDATVLPANMYILIEAHHSIGR